MKKIEAYQTSDGQLFSTEEDAKRHEMHLSKFDLIDEFLKSSLNTFTAIPQKSIARKSIMSWELWKKENAKQ